MKGYELLVKELREKEQQKQVKDIMSPRIITTEPETTLCDAINKMRENNIHGLLVAKKGKLMGIVTTYDALLVMSRGNHIKDLLVEEVMTTDVISINQNSSISEALEKMLENQINRLPVLDKNKLVGVVSTTDIINAYMDLVYEV